MPRFVVIASLTPLVAGDAFTLREWPLHLTVAPTFVTPHDAETLAAALRVVCAFHPPFDVVAGGRDGFGRARDIPVTLIAPNAALTALHEQLMTELAGVGVDFDDPDFTGPGYRPHVTVRHHTELASGTVISIRHLALVDMAPEGDTRERRVVWAHDLARRDSGAGPDASAGGSCREVSPGDW
ncbi:2'-5' RNA ligase family protein [Galbitalea soli]|uniref:2'-5' RNA ligase family protein n=1 Tax=Galbitalea soli TaxID=1268042 RepID=A0A7C9TP22_9MICO|nr:2'-5' RNA ligase family protein [Galbitalea soli]NEM90039.1 2'-5' RNA ligase family protein [Galbitalea soli]NYJ30746.1 2'-5' RNA ligase [Galbitalea soli]